jgi:hypothetical protein
MLQSNGFGVTYVCDEVVEVIHRFQVDGGDGRPLLICLGQRDAQGLVAVRLESDVLTREHLKVEGQSGVVAGPEALRLWLLTRFPTDLAPDPEQHAHLE